MFSCHFKTYFKVHDNQTYFLASLVAKTIALDKLKVDFLSKSLLLCCALHSRQHSFQTGINKSSCDNTDIHYTVCTWGGFSELFYGIATDWDLRI